MRSEEGVGLGRRWGVKFRHAQFEVPGEQAGKEIYGTGWKYLSIAWERGDSWGSYSRVINIEGTALVVTMGKKHSTAPRLRGFGLKFCFWHLPPISLWACHLDFWASASSSIKQAGWMMVSGDTFTFCFIFHNPIMVMGKEYRGIEKRTLENNIQGVEGIRISHVEKENL